MSGFAILLFIVLGICAYLLPWIVAKSRAHHNSLAIFWLTFLLGWSGIVWVVALVWACTSPAPARGV